MYKPGGFTSFDVIGKLRGMLKMRRLGHGGTLDPMAEGVLPVFAGSAARAADMLPSHDKVYRAGFKLGVSTDTQDCTGSELSVSDKAVTVEALVNTLEGFRGNIMQMPPMYSAVSVGGKRLYELARQGKTVERQPRQITIYRLELLSYNEQDRTGELEICCSKGTYVRTLINDIGDTLGCGGIMTSLLRTRACGFSLDDCVTFEALQEAIDRGEDIHSFFRPVDSIFGDIPLLRLDEARERMYRNGVKLDISRLGSVPAEAGRFRVYGAEGEFLGLAVRDGTALRVEKNFF